MDLKTLALAQFKLAAICDIEDRDIFIPLVAVPGNGMRAATCDSNFQHVVLWQFEDEIDAANKLTEMLDNMTSDSTPAA